ncbi:MAG: hypothetical protein IJ189_02425 [Clostridia bacterium]|nr:hypothetical protein [Clostridia bacterium]
MLRVANLKISLDGGADAALTAALKKLKVGRDQVLSWRVSKKSVDARDKGDVHFVMAVDVALKNEDGVLKRIKPGAATKAPQEPLFPRIQKAYDGLRPVVAGLGPGGLFAALALARAGMRPIVLERGQRVEERKKTTDHFAATGELNPESNIQFGEGGAGAFSDGKLTTGIKDPRCRLVLKELYAHGAPEEILYLARPHVGTDKLPQVVAAIREEIIALGGEVRFSSKLTQIIPRAGEIAAVRYQTGQETQEISTDALILAIGHSASDTQQMLFQAGVQMIQKPFSVGARIEHPQSLINKSQYGNFARHPALGAAEYHLSARLSDGRGAYTFCMCPGGTVVPAASRVGGVCVNGMSVFARDGENANAALLIDVRTEDFGDDHPLAGYALQRAWEERAFRAGGGGYKAPAQLAGDLLAGRETKALGDVKPTYRPGVTCADFRAVLPDFAYRGIAEAIFLFDRQLKGFAQPDAVLTGVESRSSCPVRLLRDARCESNIGGLYPCGEGAGYAGGIMSAAVDGLRVAQALMKNKGLLEE